MEKSIDTSDENDLGQAGLLLPEGQQADEGLLADELLSRASIFGPGAADFVLETMARDPRPMVQAKGCSALSAIAEQPEGRAAILAKGGVEVVLEAMMSAMAEEIELQARGCSALANLVMGEGEATVLEKGGIAAALAAGKAHPLDALVQLKCCLALGNMAFSSTGEAMVLEQGGLEQVVAAMKAHPMDPRVQEEGVDALVNISDSPGGKKRLLALGGLAVVAAVKKRHPSCAETAGALAMLLVAAAKEGQPPKEFSKKLNEKEEGSKEFSVTYTF